MTCLGRTFPIDNHYRRTICKTVDRTYYSFTSQCFNPSCTNTEANPKKTLLAFGPSKPFSFNWIEISREFGIHSHQVCPPAPLSSPTSIRSFILRKEASHADSRRTYKRHQKVSQSAVMPLLRCVWEGHRNQIKRHADFTILPLLSCFDRSGGDRKGGSNSNKRLSQHMKEMAVSTILSCFSICQRKTFWAFLPS